MSTILIVAPIVVTNWPIITGIIVSATVTVGYAVVADSVQTMDECCDEEYQEDHALQRVREEITLENSEILADARNRGEVLTVEKGNIKATFHRDVHGTLRLTIEAVGLSKEQLRKIGDELIGRVTQQYAYHRLVTEMKERGMEIVEETVEEDDTVKIRVRNTETL